MYCIKVSNSSLGLTGHQTHVDLNKKIVSFPAFEGEKYTVAALTILNLFDHSKIELNIRCAVSFFGGENRPRIKGIKNQSTVMSLYEYIREIGEKSVDFTGKKHHVGVILLSEKIPETLSDDFLCDLEKPTFAAKLCTYLPDEKLHETLKDKLKVHSSFEYKGQQHKQALVHTHLSEKGYQEAQDSFPQLLLQGPPGTGKSHQLSQRLIKLKLRDKTTHREKRAQVTRVTCHAEMTSADFIGAYQPTTDDQGKLHYRFEPGPFTRLLHRALRHLDEQHVLIIEELNRTNAAAMFAEAFQLLDRVENEGALDQHWSTYPTSLGKQVWDYLTKRNQANTKDEELTGAALDHLNGAVRLPPKFAIWATLNTADQSVFPLDTAFKRRWSFEYLGVDDGEKEWRKPAWNPLIPGYNNLHWQDLRQAINKRLEENEIEEDRHLGAFFLTRAELHVGDDTKAFLTRLLDKVVSYLREDVVRVDPAILFAEVNTGEREYVPGYAVLRRKALDDGLLSIFKGFIKDPPAFDKTPVFDKTLLEIDTYRELINAQNEPNGEPNGEPNNKQS